MSYLMGVDVGTQSVRAMIIEAEGKVRALEAASYEISIPRPGFAEQNPEAWYAQTAHVIARALDSSGLSPEDISAVGFSGQMHGLVCVDEGGRPVRDAILWLDQRAREDILRIYDLCGNDFVARQVQNKISAGFLLGSLYWLFLHEPQTYRRIHKVMTPKDYVRYRLTGKIAVDYSDAAGTAAFDNLKLEWAYPLIEKLGLDPSLFPECLPSSQVAGRVTREAALDTGLSERTVVVCGGADQCMQSIGNGIVEEGIFACNIGTAGQISACSKKPVYDKELRTNTFSHALPGRWNIMGACLASGVSLKWFVKSIIGAESFTAVDSEAQKIKPGSDGLIFLPYLAGERTPHLDAAARGMFCGLTLGHGKYHMARAVMEGVCYSLKDCMGLLTDMGLCCHRVVASGGGSNSPLWLQMQADILERTIYKSNVTEQACLGAAIAAGVGSGVYSGFHEACGRLISLGDRVYSPIPENVETYNACYKIFRDLYAHNKDSFHELSRLSS
ncbi:MAG: xylulokinase [Synergistaceae bacterium]|jgi:xylulokinase|nr:xylulokinase [Synergistaceae bacterium]